MVSLKESMYIIYNIVTANYIIDLSEYSRNDQSMKY